MPLIPLILKILVPVVVREVVERQLKKEKEMDAIFGLLRHALTTLGGVFVTKGYLGASDLEIAAGAVVTLLGVAWSVYSKRKE